MKKTNLLYEYMKLPIRVLCFGFVLLAVGFLIQNENVNIFYTFRNTYILIAAEVCRRCGEAIINLWPLFLLTSLVAKRANSGVPMAMAVFGFLVFQVVTMIFSTDSYSPQAYLTLFGISFDATRIPVSSTGIHYPLNIGLPGIFIVAYITRYVFVRSRNRSSYSLLSFLNQDTAAFLYELFLCALAAFGITLLYPAFNSFLQQLIERIASNISDPANMALYGVLDRVLSALGMPDLIRVPFWFTSLGGSYQSIAGENIVGDVAIWNYFTEASGSFAGAGRFITPYYCLNLFVLPAIYIGMYASITDRSELQRRLPFLIGALIITVLAGNPLPLEYLLIFTSPLLYGAYLVLTAVLFAVLPLRNCFLGFVFEGSTTAAALPGSFPDYIINLRSPQLFDTVVGIALVGVVAAAVAFAMTFIYYRCLSYDLLGTGKKKQFLSDLYAAVGGIDNIESASSSLFRLNLKLKDLEAVSFSQIGEIGARRLTETRSGVSLDLGSSCTLLALAIGKDIRSVRRV
ncbi:MAG: hypothetical protein IKE21_06165 [Erysipelotrichaceae bacterium]|nr:hypothetical protein [Erysipelotrichaceae bacterium]